jgi:hypothetical protein
MVATSTPSTASTIARSPVGTTVNGGAGTRELDGRAGEEQRDGPGEPRSLRART